MSHFQFPFGINVKWKGVSDTVQEALLPCSKSYCSLSLCGEGGRGGEGKGKKKVLSSFKKFNQNNLLFGKVAADSNWKILSDSFIKVKFRVN